MVDELGGSVGVELGLGEDVGVTDLHGALGDGGQALAGTVAGTGDGHVRVLIHELLSSSLDERLEGGGALVGDVAAQRAGGSGASGGAGRGTGGSGVTATGETETGEGGETTGKTEELATRNGLIEHVDNLLSRRRGLRLSGRRIRPFPLQLGRYLRLFTGQ